MGRDGSSGTDSDCDSGSGSAGSSDVIARFASEVSASAITAKAGSIVEYIQLTA